MSSPIKSVKHLTFGEFQGRSNNKLKIPKYQRAFSWKKQQVLDFLNDLLYHAFSSNEMHWFLGSFFTKGSRNNTKEVLDGQQRLTTFFILIKELMLYPSIIRSDDDKEKFIAAKGQLKTFLFNTDEDHRLILDYANKESFQTYMENDDRYTARFNENLGSQKRLNDALDIIRGFLEKTLIQQDFSKYQTLIRFINSKIQVIDIELNQNANFNELFEGLNNRGIGLSSSDLFKNLYLLHEKSSTKRKDFDKKWFEIQKKMYRINRDFEDDVMYYMHLSRGVEHQPKSVVNYLKKEIKDLETLNKNVLEFLKNRFKKIERDSNAIASIFNGLNQVGDELINLYFDNNSIPRDQSLIKKSKYVTLMTYFTWKNIKQFSIVFYALIQRYDFKNDKLKFSTFLEEVSIAIRFYLIMHVLAKGGNTLRTQTTRIAKEILSDDYSSIKEQDDVKAAYDEIKNTTINDKMQHRLSNNFSVLFIIFIQLSKEPKQFHEGRGSFSKVASCEHLAPISWEDNWSSLQLDDNGWNDINKKFHITEKGFLSTNYNTDTLSQNYVQNLIGNKFFVNANDNSGMQNDSLEDKVSHVNDNQVFTLPKIAGEYKTIDGTQELINIPISDISSLDQYSVQDIMERTEVLIKYLKESLIRENSF